MLGMQPARKRCGLQNLSRDFGELKGFWLFNVCKHMAENGWCTVQQMKVLFHQGKCSSVEAHFYISKDPAIVYAKPIRLLLGFSLNDFCITFCIWIENMVNGQITKKDCLTESKRPGSKLCTKVACLTKRYGRKPLTNQDLGCCKMSLQLTSGFITFDTAITLTGQNKSYFSKRMLYLRSSQSTTGF